MDSLFVLASGFTMFEAGSGAGASITKDGVAYVATGWLQRDDGSYLRIWVPRDVKGHHSSHTAPVPA